MELFTGNCYNVPELKEGLYNSCVSNGVIFGNSFIIIEVCWDNGEVMLKLPTIFFFIILPMLLIKV